MRWLIGSARLSLVVVVVLVGLLVVLATLQYDWIAQLSEAERVRLQEGLDLAAEGYCEDFDNEVARAFAVFDVERTDSDEELSQLLADRLTEWRSVAIWPELVSELAVIRLGDSHEVSLLCFDETSKGVERCEWDNRLLPIRRRLGDPRPAVPVIDGALPGLILVIEGPRSATAESPAEWRPPRDHLVVRFDLDFIRETILPQLTESHFGHDGNLPYLLVVSSDDLSGETIFQTDSRTRTMDPDSTGRFFGLRSSPTHPGPPSGDRRMRKPLHPRRRQAGGSEHPPPDQAPPRPHARNEEGRWVLAVRHAEGSLEEVVASVRRRNMAISAAMLLMLGFTAVLMVESTRRARQLARQQMDFVAAVSHELRTPLTAIRSAGQNLADGIVEDPEKIQSYGTLIEREGRRLTEMIGRVLTFAGIRSGRQIYRMAPVDMGEIVRAALDDGSWVLQESGFEVSTEIGDGLPLVNGDKVALRQVVTNLIDNALKYATDGRWLGVRVDSDDTPDGSIVRIEISDRGPGIPKREISLVFKPFNRGSSANGGGNPGSGLGLALVRSIVEAHGGSVQVTTPIDGGASFEVRLPVASTRAIERGEPR